MCIKSQLLTALFIAITTLTSIQTSARAVSIVATDWAPYFASTLKNGGVLSEIVIKALKRKEHYATIRWYPWNRCLMLVAKGEADFVLGAYFNEARTDTYHYSAPLFEVNLALVALKEADITSYKSLKDLKPYTIGVTKYWINTPAFDAATYLTKDQSLTHIANIRKLFGRRLDMIVTSIPVFQYEVAKLRYHNLSEVVVLDPLLGTNKLYLISGQTLEDHKKITEDFNQGLAEIKDDGTYGKIFAKHGF